jgi:hypothetical protein
MPLDFSGLSPEVTMAIVDNGIGKRCFMMSRAECVTFLTA